jgi:hypothetical protein
MPSTSPPFVTLYLQILHNNYTSFKGQERDEFIAAAREHLGRVTQKDVDEALDNPGWRERLVAGWTIAVKKWEQYVPRLGALLCRSERVFAGQGYCFALARIASEESAAHLCAYLDQYLARPDLVYNQDWVLGALLWTDKIRGESRAKHYLGPGAAWERFLSQSEAGYSAREATWLSGSFFFNMIAQANGFCEEWLTT